MSSPPGSPPAAAWDRADHRRRLTDATFDLLVVGGGIVGAGTALDAAARGMRVALVEQSDFAAGTSGRSTKLLHGGIRYLPHLEFSLVREGLLEQKVLARTADFLYEPLEFAIPLYRGRTIADVPRFASHPLLAPLALRAGLFLYDALGGRRRGRHRRVGVDELLRLVPALRTEDLKGGFLYRDAQTDDARLVISVVKTAVQQGAAAVSRMRADRLTRADGSFAVDATDCATRERLTVRARAVVAATGAFDPPPVTGGGSTLPVVHSKGIHLIVESAALGLGDRAVVLPETDDGRVLFIIPWLGTAMVGTTDTRYEGSPEHPAATPDDVDYLMRHVMRYLDVPDFQPLSSFAGLRALADGGDGTTAEASREHLIVEAAPGYVQVAGGKLTSYRRIAASAADRAALHLGMARSSTTETLLLVGAGASGGAAAALAGRLAPLGPSDNYAGWLLRRYGTEAEVIAGLLEARPELRRTLSDGTSTLAEVAYCAAHEGVQSIADFALRRTRLALFTRDHGRADAPAVAEVLAAELGWSREQTAADLAAYEEELAAECL